MTFSYDPSRPGGSPAEARRITFPEAAVFLRAQAPLQATGSRDFGRGFTHAARTLDDPRTMDRPAVRCALAKSLLERTPSELVCRLVAAVMVGATLDEMMQMELDA